MLPSSQSNFNSEDFNLRDFLAELERKNPNEFEQARIHGLTIVIVGKAGIGKSSTINTFIGKNVAHTDIFTTGTTYVKKYTNEINGINFILFDTPGFRDSNIKMNDEDTIKKIRDKVETYDCMWFVSLD